jgi:hypothetical protein
MAVWNVFSKVEGKGEPFQALLEICENYLFRDKKSLRAEAFSFKVL